MKMTDFFGVGTALIAFRVRAIVDHTHSDGTIATEEVRRPDPVRVPSVALPSFWIVHGR